jgi:predicted nucleic acid-binding protein
MQNVYWDANVFHALFGREDGRVDACERIVKAAQQGEVIIYTSAATFVECIWIKGKINKFSAEHEEIIGKFFMHKFIRPINCDRMIAESARGLVWRFPHLKPKDAIHVASAIAQQVDVMHSYDNDDLVKLDGKIGNPPLRICHPEKDERFAPPSESPKLL